MGPAERRSRCVANEPDVERAGAVCDLRGPAGRIAARGRHMPWWPALTAFAFVAAAVALWVTARADFLAHPGWLAVRSKRCW